MTLGSRIRQARQDQNLTQQTLAHDVQVRLSTISSIELGRSRPRIDLLTRIARRLGLSVDALLDEGETTASGAR
jgi:putative transcriptional regulator